MIRSVSAILLAAVLVVCSGCGVDKARVEAELASAQQQTTHLEAFIVATQPQLEALTAAAADTGNPAAAATAAKVLAAYQAAQAALPAARAAIDQAQRQLAEIQADTDGKVPWWTVAGGILLAVVPRILGALVPPAKPVAEWTADFLWRLTATRRQKAADLEPTTAKA